MSACGTGRVSGSHGSPFVLCGGHWRVWSSCDRQGEPDAWRYACPRGCCGVVSSIDVANREVSWSAVVGEIDIEKIMQFLMLILPMFL